MTDRDKLIVGGGIIFSAGVVLGYFIGTKLKAAPTTKETVTEKIPTEEPVVETEEQPEDKQEPDNVIDYRKYSKIIQEQNYAAEAEHPTDSDEDPGEDQQMDDNYIRQQCMITKEKLVEDDKKAMEEAHEKWVEEHKDKIEPITQEDYESDFSESSYQRMELRYFRYEDLLTDNEGVVIRNKEEWVGDLLDTEDYIRNNPKELDLWIHKDCPSIQDYDGWD